MVTRFSSTRHQEAINSPTGYRRRFRHTFTRGGVSQILEPVSGSFTQDTRRSARWDGRLSFAGDDLLPQRPGDLLTPFGTTVTVEAGLELLDGSVFYVPYGTYDIDSTSVDEEAGSRTVDIGLIDISERVDRYRFETPFTMGASLTLSLVIRNVIANRTGINPPITTIPILLGTNRVFGLETGTGPWEELLDVLKAFGLTSWYDRTGLIRTGFLNPTGATPYALPSITGRSVDFDSRPANVVVARGESQDDTAPVQAIIMDTEPSSPTYAGTGPGTSSYGRVTEFYSSPLITTLAQATSAATAALAANLGGGASYTFTWPYNPTVDAGDTVTYGGDTYVLDAITLDIGGRTSAQARKIS